MDEARLEAILSLIRARGGRVTTARRAIVAELLDVAGAHVTAEELAARVHARVPEVHESTVYRTLHTLADLGVVVHVHLGHGPAVYHLADDAHHHLVCEACGAVTEIPDAILRSLARRVDRDYGFALDTGHFALTGRCASCA